MIDTKTPQSPGWWLARLMGGLDNRRAKYDRLERYATGQPDLPWAPSNSSREAFDRLQRKARMNWGGFIVEATRERMRPMGFRTGADGDETGDAEAWRIWQANAMDAEAAMLFRAKLQMGEAYTIVGPPDEATGIARITAEDPRQVLGEPKPGTRGEMAAAVKVFADDIAATDRAFLYLPGRVLSARRVKVRQESLNGGEPVAVAVDVGENWEFDDAITVLPAHMRKIVPVVRHPNRCSLLGSVMAEHEDSIDDIDRINLLVLQRLNVTIMQAFRQMAFIGDAPDTDEKGDPINYDDLLSRDPGALWRLPPGSELWESGVVDLRPILDSVKDDVKNMLAISRTPMYYWSPENADGSAAGASMQKEGLNFKVHDRLIESGEPVEKTMALSFMWHGDTKRSSLVDMEVIWTPPESSSLAERMDAATKAESAGVPWRERMRMLQYSPQEIDRMARERAEEAQADPVALMMSNLERSQTPPVSTEAAAPDPAKVKALADAMGVLIRSGVDPQSAAEQVGLQVDFTGAVPVSLRMPTADAAALEG